MAYFGGVNLILLFSFVYHLAEISGIKYKCARILAHDVFSVKSMLAVGSRMNDIKPEPTIVGRISKSGRLEGAENVGTLMKGLVWWSLKISTINYRGDSVLHGHGGQIP